MMNSYFSEILQSRNLSQHDGRPLWKYNLTDDEYSGLKSHISQVTEKNFDPRDLTLYYAEWWKNEYNGGAPSKIDVFSSIGNCNFSSDDFYRYAKRGASILGIRWIQREHTLYFRTLLLQGGLPVNHLLNNSGYYTNFLKKVLELQPDTISDFAYDDNIISVLPFTSRNEAIYESCLQIVQAIWSGNEEYLSMFETKRTSTTSFKKISDELKEYKNSLEKSIKKRAKFRVHWVLHKIGNENRVKLEFNYPEIIEADEFLELLGTRDELKAEYQLIINDLLVCKFRKTLSGKYKLFWFNNSKIYWDGVEAKPEIYLSSSDGKKYEFPILLIDSPKVSEPTLWIQKTENQWILAKGNNCRHEEAAVLFNDEWVVKENQSCEKFIVEKHNVNWCVFKGTICLKSEEGNEDVVFNTGITSFDWYIKEEKPDWVMKSNIPIVRTFPQVTVLNSNNERIKDVKLFWRMAGELVWKEWKGSLPQGCIEYKIYALESTERGYFFNIGNFGLDYSSIRHDKSSIRFINVCELNVGVKNSNILEYDATNNKINICIEHIDQVPEFIKLSIARQNQRKSLQIDIIPPLQYVNIFDPNGNIVPKNSELLLNNFAGFRIIVPFQDSRCYLRLYNTQKKDITVIRQLPGKITPLREYEEIAARLFHLSDVMDKNSSVTVELLNPEGGLLNNYIIKYYNNTIRYSNENERTEICFRENVNDVDLFAVPLECYPDNIEVLSLTKSDDIFVFPEETYIFLDKFLIFSEVEARSNVNVLPCFVTRSQESNPTTPEDKQKRINNNKTKLLSQGPSKGAWETVRRYFNVCVIHKLPFSAFDILRAAASSPELLAKLFCLLSTYNEDDNFLDRTCKSLEDELGFSFHWIAKMHWDNAVEWIKADFKSRIAPDDLTNLIDKLYSYIKDLFSSSEPLDWFKQIANHIIDCNVDDPIEYWGHMEEKVMRQNLGERVLQELPSICPKIKEEYKPILPVNEDNGVVKIMLKAPLAVALSASGREERIWKDYEDSDLIRRNIQYVQWVAPHWYGKTILYCLNRLSKYEVN